MAGDVMWKKASELFREVDPGLTVVSGHRRNKKRNRKQEVAQPSSSEQEVSLSPYQPYIATAEDWEAARGVDCPKCGKEVVRLRPQDGICLQCASALDNKYFKDKRKRDRLLKYIKAHNARVEGKKKKGNS